MRLCIASLLVAVSSAAMAADEKPEVFVQLGHTSMVHAIAVSPDGRTLAAGDFSGQVKLWDTATHQEYAGFSPSTHPIMALAFTPDGREIYDGTANGWLGILDPAKRELTGAWRPIASGKEVRAVAMSAARGLYAVGGLDAAVKVISLAGNKQVATLSAPNAFVTGLAFTPDGSVLVGGDRNSIRIWDVATGTERRSIVTKENVLAVAVSRDGTLVFAGFGNFLGGSDDKSLRAYEIATGREHMAMQGIAGNTYSIAVSPDGNHAASAHGPDIRSFGSLSAEKDRSVRIWDLRSGALLHTFRGHEQHVMSVAWHPDGRTVYSGSWDRTLRAWTVASGESAVFAGTGTTQEIVPPGDAGNALATVDALGRVLQWDLESGQLAAAGPPHGLPGEHGIPESPQPLAALILDGAVHTLVQGVLEHRFEHARRGADGAVTRLHLKPDAGAATPGARAILKAAPGVTGELFIVPFAKGGVLAPGGRSAFLGVSFMASGNLHRNASCVLAWDFASASARTLPFEIEGEITAIALAADGTTLLVATEASESTDIRAPRRRTLEARDVASGRQLWISAGHAGTIRHIAVSPRARTALVGIQFEAVLVDIDSGKVLHRLKDHAKAVSALVFSPNGRYALTGSVDQRVRVWDVENGQLAASFFAHVDSVAALGVAGDGRFIVSTGKDRTMRLWRWPTMEPVAVAAAFRTGDWVMLTPEGYFSGSPGGAEQLGFRYRGQLHGLNQFYDAFYRPDLVRRKLRGEPLESLAAGSLTDALEAPPPAVRIETVPDSGESRVAARFEIASSGGGIGEIRVFHNGKLVRSDGAFPATRAEPGTAIEGMTPDLVSRALVVAASREKATRRQPAVARPDRVAEEIAITPVPGENEITVTAFNRHNTVQSRLQSTRFVSTRAAEPPRLFVLAVGINQFRSVAKDNLTYAVKDARDFTELLRAQGARMGLGALQEIRLLTDAQATREAILREFVRLQAETRPQDAMILFFASHGVIDAGAYSVVTHDYDGKIGPSSTIGAQELIDASKRIAAQRQLLVLDTCHAGGLDLALAGLYDARMTLLARNVGLHAFASAGTREQAIDGFEQNGLFTHALLKGLRSGDADANRDRTVSVFELGDYGRSTAAGIAQKLGFRQTPLVLRFGKDLPFLRLD